MADETVGWTRGDAVLTKTLFGGGIAFVCRVYTVGPPYQWTVETWVGSYKRPAASGSSMKLKRAKLFAVRAAVARGGRWRS